LLGTEEIPVSDPLNGMSETLNAGHVDLLVQWR